MTLPAPVAGGGSAPPATNSLALIPGVFAAQPEFGNVCRGSNGANRDVDRTEEASQLDNENPETKVRLGYLKAQMWMPKTDDLSEHNKAFLRKYIVRYFYEKSLYHYTTLEGFFGLANENAIWASHIRYMSDIEEFKHGRNLTIGILNKRVGKSKPKQFDTILDKAAKILAASHIPEYYVASFSMVGDDLTQWRAYGKDRGICIEFDCSTEDSYLHFFLPVVVKYRDSDKAKLIDFVVNQYRSEFRNDLKFYHNKIPEFLWGRYAESLASKLQYEFIRFKNEAFSSELEVRQVISGAEAHKFRPLRHRTRGNLIVPYHRTSDRIWRKDGHEIDVSRLPIASVTVGPMVEQNLCAESIRDFLAFKGYDPRIVRLSQLPYVTR